MKILKFHVGRGGRFNNPSHVTFKGEGRIDEGTSFEELYLTYSALEPYLNDYNEELAMAVQQAGIEFSYDKDDKKIIEDSLEQYFYDDLGELVYVKADRNDSELTEEQANSGIGLINIDNDYDTTYTLEACNIIYESNEWNAIIKDGITFDILQEIFEEADETLFKLAEQLELIPDYVEDLNYGIDNFTKEHNLIELDSDDIEIIEINGRYFTQNALIK